MEAGQKPVYYGEYLNLKTLLDTQHPKSREYGKEAHEEMLFILIHQVYELWFKQILHEFDWIVDKFSGDVLNEKDLPGCVNKLNRVIKIQDLLLAQMTVMETMSPMDFLEFRDLLIPASGFQSTQFREIEIKMGLSTDNRPMVDRKFFLGRLNKEDRAKLEEIEKGDNLYVLVERWLERLPFTESNEFDFWKAYKGSVEEMLEHDREIISTNPMLTENEKVMQLENLKSTKETFFSLLSPGSHQKLMDEGKRKLSQKATLNALFILLFREEPILTNPYNFIRALIDVDENFTTWRHKHALMAHRMLGTKIGTGGSSGHVYLKSAADNSRVYKELFDLSTFLIPKSKLPDLPESLKKDLDFGFNLK